MAEPTHICHERSDVDIITGGHGDFETCTPRPILTGAALGEEHSLLLHHCLSLGDLASVARKNIRANLSSQH